MDTSVSAHIAHAPLQPRDATLHGTLSLPALCAHLQDAAGSHADALGVAQTDLLEQNQSWVLARLHVKMNRLPSWHDTLTIETWPSVLSGPFAQREFLFRVDAEAVGRATSTWIVFDQDRRRPARPPRTLHERTWPDRPPALDADIPEVEVPEHADYTRPFRVRFHDLDLNRHVNNARYVAWALETLPIGWLDAHAARGLTLHFKHETTADTPVGASATVFAGGPERAPIRVVHHLYHAENGTTLAQAETRWTAR